MPPMKCLGRAEQQKGQVCPVEDLEHSLSGNLSGGSEGVAATHRHRWTSGYGLVARRRAPPTNRSCI